MASSAAAAREPYVSHLDAQFNPDSLNVSTSASCTGDECTAKASCATTAAGTGSSGDGLLLAGLGIRGHRDRPPPYPIGRLLEIG